MHESDVQLSTITPLRCVILMILLLDYLPVTTQWCKLDNLLSAVQGPWRNFTVRSEIISQYPTALSELSYT